MFVLELIYLVIALAVCITVHEAAHAWTALKLGDPTAKREGRVSLNPMRHLDPLGTILIFIARIGWGKPTPVNPNNLKHPIRDSAIISIAGPLSNIATALVMSLFMKYVPLPLFLLEILKMIFWLSIALFIFNLIPVAPLDGANVLGIFVPRKYLYKYNEFLEKGPMILMVVLVLDLLIRDIAGFSFFLAPFGKLVEIVGIGILLIT